MHIHSMYVFRDCAARAFRLLMLPHFLRCLPRTRTYSRRVFFSFSLLLLHYLLFFVIFFFFHRLFACFICWCRLSLHSNEHRIAWIEIASVGKQHERFLLSALLVCCWCGFVWLRFIWFISLTFSNIMPNSILMHLWKRETVFSPSLRSAGINNRFSSFALLPSCELFSVSSSPSSGTAVFAYVCASEQMFLKHHHTKYRTGRMAIAAQHQRDKKRKKASSEVKSYTWWYRYRWKFHIKYLPR